MEWLGLAALAAGVAWLPSARARSLGGAGLALVTLGAAATRFGGAAPPPSFVLVNRLLLATGGLTLLIAAALRHRLGPMPAHPARSRDTDWADPVLLVGLAGATILPGLLLSALGAAVAIAAAGRSVVSSRRAAWFVPLLAGAAALGAAVVLTLVILGPMGDRLNALAAGPFSPAAERLLVMLFGAGTLLMAGIPPLRRAPWGVSLAPVAAIFLVRVITPGFPGGTAEWQPLAFVMLGGAVAWSCWCREWPALLVCGGLLVLWSGQEAAALPGAVLVLTGWLLERFGGRLSGRWRGLPIVPAAGAGGAGLVHMLGSQVVLSVAATVALAMTLIAGAMRRTA